MHGQPHTVLIADDHPIVRAGVRLLLGQEPAFAMLGEAADAAATFSAVERNAPDLLILDLWMGGNDGVELVRRVHARVPQTRILVYSMNDERVLGPRVMRAGAAGYVMKDRGLEELLTALRVIAGGRRYLSPALADELTSQALGARRLAERKTPALAALTDRELQILRLIGRGQPSGRIAEALTISPKTVGAHRENLKNKLHAANGAELAQLAVALVRSRML